MVNLITIEQVSVHFVAALAGPAHPSLPYLLRKYTASAGRLMTTCYPFGGSERSERLKNLISAAGIWQFGDLKAKSLCAPTLLRCVFSEDARAQSHPGSPDCARYYALETTLAMVHAHSHFAAGEKCGKMNAGVGYIVECRDVILGYRSVNLC